MTLMTLLLNQVFGQWLSLILHILLELVWPLAEGRGIGVAWAARALLRFEILMHQVGKETAPVELEAVTLAILRFICLDPALRLAVQVMMILDWLLKCHFGTWCQRCWLCFIRVVRVCHLLLLIRRWLLLGGVDDDLLWGRAALLVQQLA